ncbi:hypothetical protein EXIGLDRAFT_752798 [Exidia glandulosa HHB12029]|uniref:Cupredoxin n=1 Tax=Exidia glandulosa HHB12029 TaxID=1314781 RepID=A0A165EAH3_EXIGL|nr:hypothetical protein EXIGLDRAFT_752798 [Exidia glandulosa HHB12029]
MMLKFLSVSTVLLAAAVQAKQYITVSVGGGGRESVGTALFSHAVIRANVGDIVSFVFHPTADDPDSIGNHSVVQTSADAPCSALPNGFASPLGVNIAGSTFALLVKDASIPVYFACAAPLDDDVDSDHCQAGEVGVINPPADFEINSLISKASAASAGGFSGVPADGTEFRSGIGAIVEGFYESNPFDGTPSDSDTDSGGRKGISTAAIVGIVIGVVVGVLVAAAAVWRLVMVKLRKAKSERFSKRVSAVIQAKKTEEPAANAV